MRQQEVKLGGKYFAKVSGSLCVVKITGRTPYKRGRLDVFEAENLRTGRRLRLTSARLLGSVEQLCDRESQEADSPERPE